MSSKALISVLKGETSVRRPLWFMRQAGRYLPEYREVRKQAGSFLDLCYNPELAAEVTLQPLRRYDLDAAIIFADILVVPHAMGNGLRFAEGEGPLLETIRSGNDLKRLSDGISSSQFAAVGESLSRVKAALPPHVALIGFCGAPWTVASYMVEGRSSDRQLARQVAYERPAWFVDLLDMLVQSSIAYLVMQVSAGAEVVQIFDSWAGDLSSELFQACSLDPIQQVVNGFKQHCPDIPVIVFAKGAGYRHGEVAQQTACQAVGIEAEIALSDVVKLLPAKTVVQGNLDPVLLLCEEAIVRKYARLTAAAVDRSRHIFNLGHGIKQQTQPQALSWVIEEVRAYDRG